MSWIELVAQRRPPTVPPGMKPPENAADWFRIENTMDDPECTDIYVYDAIGGWFGIYTDDFIRDLKSVTTKNINLRINSPGGSVFDGVTIANAIRRHPANVTVYVDGLAASIASVIALSGDRMVMMPQTSFMIHDASGGCYGNAADMESMRDLLDKQSDNIAGAYAAVAGGTVAEWRERMKAETWYTADEAVEAGLADEVMPLPRRQEETEASTSVHTRMTAAWDLTAYRYAGRDKAPMPIAAQLTEEDPAVEDTAPAEPVEVETKPVHASVIAGVFDDTDAFFAHLRELVREEIANAFPPPPEEEEEDDEDPEDANGEDPEAASDPEADPDENPFAQAEPAVTDSEPPPEPSAGDPPGDTPAEPHDEADPWNSRIGLFHAPTSPSADDVFAQLKEGWK